MNVSVIIPAYQCEDLIVQALQSVFDQTPDDCYRLHEVIVVDDGSTDGTGQAIKAYQMRHERHHLIYIQQRNSGPSAARNTGMVRASGDLIAFLDADDLWTPDKLKRQVPLFRKDRQIGIAYGQFINRVYDKNNQYTEYPVIRQFFRGDIKKELLAGNFIGTSTAMIRREVIDKVGLFDNELRLAEDYDFWLRIADCYDAAYCDAPLLVKRYYGDQNTSGGRSLKMLYSTRAVVANHIGSLDREERNEVIRAQDISEIVTFILLGERAKSFQKIASSNTGALSKLKYSLIALAPIKFINYFVIRRNNRISGS